jgi:hypothetical protein
MQTSMESRTTTLCWSAKEDLEATHVWQWEFRTSYTAGIYMFNFTVTTKYIVNLFDATEQVPTDILFKFHIIYCM